MSLFQSTDLLTSTCLELNSMGTNTCAHGRVMIVDDVAINVKLLRAQLEQAGFRDTVGVTDATQAFAMIQRERPHLVLLDVIMPEVSGLDILRAIRQDEKYAHLPVLILTSAESRELKRQALDLGATDFLPKPVDAEELIPRVRNALLVKSYQDDLERRVRERTEELENAWHEAFNCLARASEYRDDETGRHVLRVGGYAGIIADELGLEPNRVAMIQQAAKLHDVGKIGLPDSILLKSGKLTPEEFEAMQDHCRFGMSICHPEAPKELFDHTTFGTQLLDGCLSPLMKLASSIALTHHERWDGKGYPLGLAGSDIPIEGRITAVADVFDALSHERPYKPAFPLQKCFAIMREQRGAHFDPVVLDAFLSRSEDIVAIHAMYDDTK